MMESNIPTVRRKKRKLRAKRRVAETVKTEPDNPLMGYVNLFLEWACMTGYSPDTAKTRRITLIYFIEWCDARGIAHPMELTREVLEAYQRHLYLYRQKNGKPLSIRSQTTRLHPLCRFCKWLARERHVLYNAAAELVMPRAPKSLPKVVLSVAQVERLMEQPDIGGLTGVRDRAMLEALYSTGMRRAELINLTVSEVNLEARTVMIRQGKGRRDRLVPIGERACHWIARYLEEVRPRLMIRQDDWTLFLTDYGEQYIKQRLTGMVSRYLQLSGVEHGSCHALRHACATHMLENGADTRFIQALLGHSELSTTQIYTQVAIGKLQEIHAATHPARWQGRGAAQDTAAGVAHGPARETLLERLESEADEESGV